jgi:hypothetical protein
MGRVEGRTSKPLDVDRIEYEGPGGSSIAMHGNLPAELAAAVRARSEQEWEYRIFLAMGQERHVILCFQVGAPPAREAVFGQRWDVERALLYSLLAGDVKGTVSVFADKKLKDIARFTATPEGDLFTRFDPPRTPEQFPEEHWSEDETDPEEFVDCEPTRAGSWLSGGLVWGIILGGGTALVALLLRVLLRRKPARLIPSA